MSYIRQHTIEKLHALLGRREDGGRAPDQAIVIRAAGDADAPALLDLATLDSARPLTGPALIAQVDGRPWAAFALQDGRVIADPFHPTAAAITLLRLRASQLRAAPARTRTARPGALPRRARSDF